MTEQAEIASFGELTLLRIDDVMRAVGLSKSQIYQLIGEGTFPQPIRLSSRCSRWSQKAVRAWLESLTN